MRIVAMKKQTQFKPNSNPIKACPERSEFTLSVIEGNGPILEAMIVNFCAAVYYERKPTFAVPKGGGRIIQSSISPLPSVVGRESSRQADKIALKIYPFGIDCPIVLKEILRKMSKNVILSGALA